MPNVIRKTESGELKSNDNSPVKFGESSFSKIHWDKLSDGKENDLLEKLKIKSDNRKKVTK